jgi:endonuclease YncB( thermonuclease family)
VVKIIDGDTFDILTKEKKTFRIRMNGIDSPERRQDFYQSAKNALAGYIFNKDVKLFITGHDRNKWAIAMVYQNGDNVNLAMIRSGFAWHFKKYSTDTSFAKAEQQARLAKRGLWSKDHPIAPWEFRRKSKRVLLATTQ